LVSNNLGIMWVGMEATTLLTAFLICVHRTRESLEAMWKYLLICSIGVALAFMGTLLMAASAAPLHLDSIHVMLWTSLRANAAHLDPMLVKIAFVFLAVGYGTKAGLAPMHTWLPDAHSQAPTPVSAVFSGFMLNTALYCIMRYVPIVETATGGNGWCLGILTLFGLVSIVVAAAFILFQHDLKRLLAYHSVEHIGIIALGVGLGGLGTFAALFHTLNHSLCKTLSFFAAGRLGQLHGTHDMRTMKGTLASAPLWGTAIFGSLLALIGVAPFALFVSEFQIVKAALDTRAVFELVVFLSGAAVVFVGALGHAIPLVWAKPTVVLPRYRATRLEVILVALPLGILLLLGLWMPDALQNMLNAAADVIHNQSSIGSALWGKSAL
jgi:hydrogenase-4 component F